MKQTNYMNLTEYNKLREYCLAHGYEEISCEKIYLEGEKHWKGIFDYRKKYTNGLISFIAFKYKTGIAIEQTIKFYRATSTGAYEQVCLIVFPSTLDEAKETLKKQSKLEELL